MTTKFPTRGHAEERMIKKDKTETLTKNSQGIKSLKRRAKKIKSQGIKSSQTTTKIVKIVEKRNSKSQVRKGSTHVNQKSK